VILPPDVPDTIWLSISPRMVDAGLAELNRARDCGASDPQLVHWIFGVMENQQKLEEEEFARQLVSGSLWPESGYIHKPSREMIESQRKINERKS
jgi:hypothetical protein